MKAEAERDSQRGEKIQKGESGGEEEGERWGAASERPPTRGMSRGVRSGEPGPERVPRASGLLPLPHIACTDFRGHHSRSIRQRRHHRERVAQRANGMIEALNSMASHDRPSDAPPSEVLLIPIYCELLLRQ
eukprot:3773544-Amphidinium_carterae.1